MVPDEALEAAVTAHCEGTMRAALEAALPILLSHEREETRLAHLDAVVNAATVDRLEREIVSAKADALREAADAILTNDPLDYWDQHLPEGLGFQEAMSLWLKAHAAAKMSQTP